MAAKLDAHNAHKTTTTPRQSSPDTESSFVVSAVAPVSLLFTRREDESNSTEEEDSIKLLFVVSHAGFLVVGSKSPSDMGEEDEEGSGPVVSSFSEGLLPAAAVSASQRVARRVRSQRMMVPTLRRCLTSGALFAVGLVHVNGLGAED